MADRVFVDTNVFVYAEDDAVAEKQARARSALAEVTTSGRAVVSTQVLQELYVALTKKLSFAPDRARDRVSIIAQLDVVLVRPELILGAIDLHRLHPISFWDALIVRCAAAAGCATLLTEDLQHNQSIEGVRVRNPFIDG